MNIILLSSGDHWLAEDVVRLVGRRADHIRQQLKAVLGQTVRVGLMGGPQGTAEITALDADAVVLSVALDQPPPPRHRFDVVLALPRPKMLRRVLRSCAEFGVGDIHIINSYRVEKSFWQSPLLHAGRLRQALLAGLERSGNTQLPNVYSHRRFKPFIQDRLKEVAGTNPIYVAHPGNHPMLVAPHPAAHLILIGPEGGFIPYEIELIQDQGGQARSLGDHILSVDTAIPAALARGLP